MSSVRDLLEQIYADRGELTPTLVVEEATPTSSPLHGYFEWDDTTAAHEYRLVQARHLIRSVRVRLDTTTGEGEEIAVRVFHAVPSRGTEQYVPDQFLTVVERDEVLAQALADWQAFKRKWHGLSALFDAIRRDVDA